MAYTKQEEAERTSAYIAQSVVRGMLSERSDDVESVKQGIQCFVSLDSDDPSSTKDCDDPSLAKKVATALSDVEKEYILPGQPEELVNTCRKGYRKGLAEFIE
jgi:hypothetical protein